MTAKTLPPRDKSGRFTAAEDEQAGEPPGSPIQPTSRFASLPDASSSTARILSLPDAPSSIARGKARAISPGHFDLPAQDDPSAREAHPSRPSRSHYARNRSPSQSSSSSESDPPESPMISQNDFNTAVRNLLAWRPPGDSAPGPFKAAPTSRRRAASPAQWPRARHAMTTTSVPNPSVSAPAKGAPTGIAAMPAGKSQRAPYFSGEVGESLSEFLREYEDLADGNGLTERQKVETILRYVPRSVRNFWADLPGYAPAKWSRFRAEIERFYPDVEARTRCTRHALTEFVELSAESRIRDENDIMKYYRNFLTIALPLCKKNKLPDDDFHTVFFDGFHPDDQEILLNILFTTSPNHPPDEPFDTEDVVSVACRYFANDRLFKPLQRRARSALRGRSKTRQRNPDKLIRRLFSDDRGSKGPARDESESDSEPDNDAPTVPDQPAYETKSVRFREPSSDQAQLGNKEDALTLLTKLKSLSVCEPSYLLLYSQCQERFPHVVKHLPKPDLFATQAPPTAATVAYQSPPTPVRQPWAQRVSTPPTPSSTTPTMDAEGEAFFSDRNGTRSRGCTFCGVLGHRVRGCPAAEEYYRTGRVKVVDNRLHLPTGEPIPNDGRGLGLKASLDAWLAANPQPSSDTTASPPQRDLPPHKSYSFEIVPEHTVPAGAYITEEADIDSDSNDDVYTSELYDMYEVFATKKKDAKPSKAPASTQESSSPPPPPATAQPTPSVPTGRTPQYRYQASAEDQALTKELFEWTLKGKLDMVTPAHIYAASPPIRKELMERLKPRRVETASFEQADDEADSVSVLGLAAKREAEFSLPLREIDVLVNSCKTEAGVLDQGSQIVVIREDLANEVGAQINTQRILRMEGANSSTSCTLGLGFRV